MPLRLLPLSVVVSVVGLSVVVVVGTSVVVGGASVVVVGVSVVVAVAPDWPAAAHGLIDGIVALMQGAVSRLNGL